MSSEVKLITANCGLILPYSVGQYKSSGGFEGLKKALSMSKEDIIKEIKVSKLLGRGGAAYPTSEKWQQLFNIKRLPKYIICNADEGEPGTFKDKFLLEKAPLMVIEGMLIAGYVFDSHEGYIYIRGEYPFAKSILENAIKNAVEEGYLGNNIMGTDFSYNISLISGAGAYVCGENSSLLNSIEGKAGRPRVKPPHLAEVGLYGMPTLVNNVETFANIPYIVEKGGSKYSSLGTKYSTGTKLICLCGNVRKSGVYEIPFGITLREIIYEIGGGIQNDRKLKFVHIGGQSGPCLPASSIDIPYCYYELKSKGLLLGSGAILVVDDSHCVINYLKCVTEFFIHECCGKCTPCREGNMRILEILNRISRSSASNEDIENIKRISKTMKISSFCGLGETATVALSSCLESFSEEIMEHLSGKCMSNECSIL